MNQRNKFYGSKQTNANSDEPIAQRIKVFSVHGIHNDLCPGQLAKCNILRVKINHGDTCDPEENDCPTVETTVSHTPYLHRDKLDSLISKTNQLLSSISPYTRNAAKLANNTLFISSSVCNNKNLQHSYTIATRKNVPVKNMVVPQFKIGWGTIKRPPK